MASLESATVDDASGCTASAPAPAVHEVEFDEHGQTWDVYGAEFDPVIVGQAIQAHLQHIMKVHNQNQPSTAQEQSGDRGMTSRDDVIATSQSRASVREKRDVISRFFQRYMRTETPTVKSNS